MIGILIINKPAGWTSHDVVSKMRRVLGERRIGHGGTLDPMATGVLPLFVGRATRAVEFIENAEKEYIAGLRLGIETDTQDTTGNILLSSEVNVTAEELSAVLESFIGERDQIPPMYSAVKIGGKKLYEYARAGKEISRPARRISIGEMELISFDGREAVIRISCSKGTYIRTICHELGLCLGCGGAMSSLIRTKAGRFDLSMAKSMEEVIAEAEKGNAERLLLPVDSLFSDLDALTLDIDDEKRCRNGAPILKTGIGSKRYRVYSGDGRFLMLGQARPDGTLNPVKNFFDI